MDGEQSAEGHETREDESLHDVFSLLYFQVGCQLRTQRQQLPGVGESL